MKLFNNKNIYNAIIKKLKKFNENLKDSSEGSCHLKKKLKKEHFDGKS